MRNQLSVLAVVAFLLTGCAEEQSPQMQVEDLEADLASVSEAPTSEFGFVEAMEEGPSIVSNGNEEARREAAMAETGTTADTSDVPPDTQIAYSYSWGFQVSADDLPTLQERHRALCSELGADCRILSLSQSGNEDYAYGRVRMKVVAEHAEAFGDALSSAGDALDAEQISFAISGEDLTDDMIDTEARLAARRELRDRLMEVLRTRQGSVSDLVAAERGVADVNEEIDAAASRLENMRNRVAYSDISIEYDPQLGNYNVGFWAPIANALSSVTSTLGVTIAALVYVAVALIPISLFLLGLRWIWRRIKRWRARPIKSSALAAEG